MPAAAQIPSQEQLDSEVEILNLRRQGVRPTEIAIKLNLPKSTVHYRIKSALARNHKAPAAEVLQLELDRLDALQEAVWVKAIDGDLQAWDRVMRAMERRAKYLGLDHADGLAERMLRVESDKVRLLALAFGKALDAADLPAEVRQQVTQVMLAELRAHVEEDDEDTDDVDVAG